MIISSAPNWRSTLTRIRDDARACRPAPEIARDLEWPVQRLWRVARAHGIELVGEFSPTVATSQAPAARRPARIGISPDAAIEEQLRTLPNRLPKRQRQVFTVLARTLEDGRWLTALQICDCLKDEVPTSTISNTIHALRAKLRGTKLRIASRRYWGGGGYRMVTADSDGDQEDTFSQSSATPPLPHRFSKRALTRDMNLKAILRAIPVREASVLTVLSQASGNEGWLLGKEVASRSYPPVPPSSVAKGLRRLRERLEPTRYDVESRHGGGYRLVERAS